MTVRGARYFAGLLTLLSAAAGSVCAQSAQLSGLVMDQTGGILPGASVLVIHLETGARRKTVSNTDGLYSIPLLQPGTYQMTAVREGFRPLLRDNVT